MGNTSMDLRAGIMETAQALGMDPTVLATIISYETGGTMDPSQAGPTTQWGQHRGLIQFGEPQAQQYGVNWDDPAGSQLGANGAIVRYFQDNGYEPGMGLLDAYSIVNAGGPGLYNRSDANNGGAPGTVRDKVEGQMEGHRRRATELFGGTFVPGNYSPPTGNALAGAGEQQPQRPDEPQNALERPQMASMQADPRAFMSQRMNALDTSGFNVGNPQRARA